MTSRSNLNIADLERILNERRSELDRVHRQRTELERKLAELDKQISKMEGSNGVGRKRGPGTRPRNERPLPDVVESVMRDAGKPMRVPEIVEAVLGAGYQSGSANFKGIVNQALIKEKKRFGQVERGVYQLVKK